MNLQVSRKVHKLFTRWATISFPSAARHWTLQCLRVCLWCLSSLRVQAIARRWPQETKMMKWILICLWPDWSKLMPDGSTETRPNSAQDLATSETNRFVSKRGEVISFERYMKGLAWIINMQWKHGDPLHKDVDILRLLVTCGLWQLMTRLRISSLPIESRTGDLPVTMKSRGYCSPYWLNLAETKVKLKLSLCLIKYYAMKTYGGVEV
jgi:hypothetical protein